MDDLAAELEESLDRHGLTQYKGRLTDELSCSSLDQLRALDSSCCDALLLLLRPFPGHHTRLVGWLDAIRSQQPPYGKNHRLSSERQRQWRATLSQLQNTATKRGDGSRFAHIALTQPQYETGSDHPGAGLQGAFTNRPPPLTRPRTTQRVRVLTKGVEKVLSVGSVDYKQGQGLAGRTHVARAWRTAPPLHLLPPPQRRQQAALNR